MTPLVQHLAFLCCSHTYVCAVMYRYVIWFTSYVVMSCHVCVCMRTMNDQRDFCSECKWIALHLLQYLQYVSTCECARAGLRCCAIYGDPLCCF